MNWLQNVPAADCFPLMYLACSCCLLFMTARHVQQCPNLDQSSRPHHFGSLTGRLQNQIPNRWEAVSPRYGNFCSTLVCNHCCSVETPILPRMPHAEYPIFASLVYAARLPMNTFTAFLPLVMQWRQGETRTIALASRMHLDATHAASP